MTAAQQYRTLPATVDAMQWTGDNEADIAAWVGGPSIFHSLNAFTRDRSDDPDSTALLYVAANGRWLPITTGEWVLRDTVGFYPCKPEIFAAKYERVGAFIEAYKAVGSAP